MKKPASLKILDSIRVDNPCPEAWASMQGNDKSRFCSKCSHSVNNLSELTPDQAAALLNASQGKRVCVRYNTSPDGNVIFKQRQSIFSSALRGASFACVAALAFLGLQSELKADSLKDQSTCAKEETLKVMGEMVAAPTASASPTPSASSTPVMPEIRGKIAVPEVKAQDAPSDFKRETVGIIQN